MDKKRHFQIEEILPRIKQYSLIFELTRRPDSRIIWIKKTVRIEAVEFGRKILNFVIFGRSNCWFSEDDCNDKNFDVRKKK